MNLEKQLRKALGIDMSGGASTAGGRQSAADLDQMVHDAGRQTRGNNTAGRAFSKAFDDAVLAKEAELAAARDEYAVARARTALVDVLRRRAVYKMIVSDNARSEGRLPHGRFGPASADLFGGTTHSLPDDIAVKGF